MSDVKEMTSDFITELGEAARRNPLSAAFIGMGMLWLFTGGSKVAVGSGEVLKRSGSNRIPEATDTLSSLRSGISSGAGMISDAAGSSFDAMRERGADALDQAANLANTMPSAGEVFETARDNLTELFEAQPLALGVIGLAIGAGIAAALPGTNVEDTYFGDASETVRAKTADIAGEQIDKATTLATDMFDAASEEAHKQGLTSEGARAAAGEIADRLGRVVKAAQAGAPGHVE